MEVSLATDLKLQGNAAGDTISAKIVSIPRNRVLSHPTCYGFLESHFLCFQICANPFYLWPGVFELALFKLGQLKVESYNINKQYNCVMSPQQGGVVRNVTLPYPTLLRH